MSNRDSLRERNLEMFKFWLAGKTYKQVADEFKVSRALVNSIASSEKWRKLKSDIRSKEYQHAIEGSKKIVSNLMRILEKDINRIQRRTYLNPDVELSSDERDYLLKMVAVLNKEIKSEISESSGSENSGGLVTSVTMVASEEAMKELQSLTVIPPGDSVTFISAESSKAPVSEEELEEIISDRDEQHEDSVLNSSKSKKLVVTPKETEYTEYTPVLGAAIDDIREDNTPGSDEYSDT